MRHSRTLATLAVVPLTFLAACGGGGSSDKDQITKIIKDGGKDPATICDHLDPTLVKQLGGPAGCKKAAKSADNGDKNVDIKSVDVKGDAATAKIKGASGDQTISFTKKSGDWVVTQTK
jgi:hypothetical protein